MKQNNTDDSQASRVIYNSVEIKKPSQDLIDDFSIPEKSFLEALTKNPQLKLQVVVSVASGTGQAKDIYEKALEPLLQRLLPNQYDAYFTTSADSVRELTLNRFLLAADAGQQQALLLLSGDGGLVDILNVLSSEEHSPKYRSPDVALVPIGTGNALANSSGILDSTFGLKTLLRGQAQQLPAFRASFSSGARYLVDEARQEEALQSIAGVATAFGCVVCSWGLHAALVADSDTKEYRKFGAERFKMAAKENLFPSDGSLPHAYRGKISIVKTGEGDWQVIDRNEHGYALSTLVSNLEAGFTISPSSQPLDGVLRLVHFAPLSGQEAVGVMGKAYQGGQHIHDERIGYQAVKALKIEFDEDDANWRRVCIDGKIIRVEKGGWVEVRTDIDSGVNLVV